MQFLRQNNGNLTISGHPGWRIGDTPGASRLLTADELVDRNFGKLVVDPGPPTVGADQRIEVAPVGDWITDARTATRGYVVVDLTAEEIAARDAAEADQALREATRGDAFVQQFIGMTRGDIDTYIEANVTNLAGARALLKRTHYMLLLLARREYR